MALHTISHTSVSLPVSSMHSSGSHLEEAQTRFIERERLAELFIDFPHPRS